MVKTKKIDMCNGPLFLNIIRYTVPIIISGLLQMFFNAADIIVIGQFRGSLSVAGIGATLPLINLLLNFFIGFSAGVSAVTAKNIGAKKDVAVFKTVHTTIPLALFFGIILTVITLLVAKPILISMDTPSDILDLSIVYLKVYSLGMVFTIIYNFAAAILRASGDSKSPLMYLFISGIMNIIFNIVFVKLFSMDVEGVAIATVISQFLSAFLVILKLMRTDDACRFHPKKAHIYVHQLKKIVAIGAPAGLQSIMFSISNVFIQSSINSFGASAVAGNSAANNIEGFVYVIFNSFSHTALNFTGQNIGAGKHERINKVYSFNIITMFLITVSVIFFILLFSKNLLSLYITNDNAAIALGTVRMKYICTLYFLCGIMQISTGVVRGMGASLSPMIISFFCVCGVRILTVFTFFRIPAFHALDTLYISYPVSWILCIVFTFFVFMIQKKKLNKSNEMSMEA